MIQPVVRTLVTRARAASSLALARVACLPWPQPVQGFGERGLQQVMAYWPELVRWTREQLQERAGLRVARASTAPRQAVEAPTRAAAQTHASAMQTPHAAVTLQSLLQQLQDAHGWQERARAVSELGSFDDDAALSAIIAALRDTSVEVASAAIAALGAHASPIARAALHEVLDNAQSYFHPLTRVAALLAIAAEPRTPSTTARLHAAVRDAAAEVSLAAVSLLSASAPDDQALLLQVAQDGSGFFVADVRLAALQALAREGQLTPTRLQQWLSSEPPGEIGAYLLSCLGAQQGSQSAARLADAGE